MFDRKILVVAVVAAMAVNANAAPRSFNKAGQIKVTTGQGTNVVIATPYGTGVISFDDVTGACTNCGIAATSGMNTLNKTFSSYTTSSSGLGQTTGFAAITEQASSLQSVTPTYRTSVISATNYSVLSVPGLNNGNGIFTSGVKATAAIAAPSLATGVVWKNSVDTFKTDLGTALSTPLMYEVSAITGMIGYANSAISTYNASNKTDTKNDYTGSTSAQNIKTMVTNITNEVNWARENVYNPIVGIKAPTMTDTTANAAFVGTGAFAQGAYTSSTTTDTHTMTVNGVTYQGRLVSAGLFKTGTQTAATVADQKAGTVTEYFVVDYSQAISNAGANFFAVGTGTSSGKATVSSTGAVTIQ